MARARQRLRQGGYAVTSHSSQGQTADRVLIRADTELRAKDQRGATGLHAFRHLYLGDLLRLHRLLYLPSDRFLDRHRAGLFENALPPAHWAGRLWSSSGAIAKLERSLIIERVRAGMRRARLEGRPIRRKALVLDRAAIHRDRQQAYSLGQLAKAHLVSRTTIHRVLGERIPAVTEGLQKTAAKTQQNHGRISTIRPFRKV
jgi:hypothetical protein